MSAVVIGHIHITRQRRRKQRPPSVASLQSAMLHPPMCGRQVIADRTTLTRTGIAGARIGGIRPRQALARRAYLFQSMQSFRWRHHGRQKSQVGSEVAGVPIVGMFGVGVESGVVI